MSLLDDLLRMFGTNRIRMRWKLDQWKKALGRSQRSAANQAQSLAYEHQLCPSCGHPEAKTDVVCSRCGARLRGAAGHKAHRALSWLLPEGVPVATMVFLAACAALYFVTVRASHDFVSDYEGGFSPSGLQLLLYGGNYTELVVIDGQWWRLVTANFLHGDVWHIAMNAYALWVSGTVIEEKWGWNRVVVLLIVTGIAGHALSTWWHASHGGALVIGASTAAFGLMGFIIGHVLRYRGRSTSDLKERFVPWLIYGLIMSFAVPRVDLWGHLGGLFAGLPLGALVGDKQTARRLPDGFWTGMALACVAGVAVSFYYVAQFQAEVRSQL
jgi:rhomboid protease GluP